MLGGVELVRRLGVRSEQGGDRRPPRARRDPVADREALADHLVGGPARDEEQPRAVPCRDTAHLVALAAPRKAGIDHEGRTAREGLVGAAQQIAVDLALESG